MPEQLRSALRLSARPTRQRWPMPTSSALFESTVYPGATAEVILAGRRINDGMGNYVAEQTIKQLIASGHPVKDASVIVLGMTFKEDCSDVSTCRSGLPCPPQRPSTPA